MAWSLFGSPSTGGRPAPNAFRIGERVLVRWRGQEGEIIDINGDLYTVALAHGKTTTCRAEDLEKVR